MSYLSAQYVEKFRCIGEACGSACCRGWSVQLTSKDRERLELALTEAPRPLRPLTHEVVSAPEGVASKTHPYVMKFDETGACPYVTADHRCQIHATVGEGALPGVCAQYPREVNQLGSKLELWASLSCPEAARLCLLHPQGADLVNVAEVAGLRYVNAHLEINDQTPDYVAYLDEIRSYLFELLSVKGHTLQKRMFFVAHFAHRISSYFHEHAKDIDRQRLKQDMTAVAKPSMLSELAAELDSLSISGAYAIALVEAVIGARKGLSEYPAAMPTQTFAQASSYETSCVPKGIPTTDPLLQNWLEYSVRRMLWEKDFAELLDQAFENYCKVFWMKEWYVQSPNLMAHATACMLRVAILRYRLFCHPALENPCQSMPLADRQALLERTLLTVVTEVARAIEHDRPFQKSLNVALARRGMQDLAHASMLLVL
jgi:lysine-N-methylase